MNDLAPINQHRLFGLSSYLLELIRLYRNKIYTNKLLLSGQKGIGKATLAYHFINYVLSQNEDNKYDLEKFEINPKNSTFKTILNKSNKNLINIDISHDKKSIDIDQIRNLIINLNKTSFNDKPRFVLIDNIELLNTNTTNALLKILEEPNFNIYFILINNHKKNFPTLLSRCIDFKINLSNNECLEIIYNLFDEKLENLTNIDLINYYFTPGNIYHLLIFARKYDYNLLELSLKDFLKLLIKENHYKNDPFIRYIIFDLIEFYFTKLNISFSKNIYEKYSYFLKRIADTKTYNLDENSLFVEFEEEVLNG